MKGIFLVLLISVFISGSHGQGSKNLKKTEALFLDAKNKAQAGEAEKAIDLLNQLLRIDPAYYMAHFALADIYHEKGKLDLEEKELNEGLKVCGDAFPNGYKFLAQILYKKGEYAEAFNNINKYLQINKSASPDDRRLFESCSFAKEAVQHPVPFQPENLGQEINTVEDEYFPCLDGEGRQLVFTRLLKTSADGQKLPFPQEDLFRSVKDSDKWRNAQPLDAMINTPENEGAQCISADGRLLFFTACGRQDGLGSCDIYMSVRKQGKWSEPVNLGAPVNSNAWETQPSISADGHFLYFTSNRKGGKGKMDIWRAEKIGVTSDGYPVYGKVINLENINTPGDELSPFIHADGKTLYFASDFWPGMGGKDLFKVSIAKDKISTPVNLGYPINTKDNEEGLVVETSGETAFFYLKCKGLWRKRYLFF
jgi:hypothetical protein